MALSGVLFDFGYTLFAHESLPITIADCARRLGTAIGEDHATALAARIDAAAMTPEELRHPRDLDPAVWRERWKVLYSIADEAVEGLGGAVHASMHDPTEWIPFEQTAATLKGLSESGAVVGVISNTGWDVRDVFAAHAMSSFISSFTLSFEVGAVKPDGEIFRRACSSLGLPPDEVLMVGDDPRSDGGAVMAGIRTLLLPRPAPGANNGIGTVLRLLLD